MGEAMGDGAAGGTGCRIGGLGSGLGLGLHGRRGELGVVVGCLIGGQGHSRGVGVLGEVFLEVFLGGFKGLLGKGGS